MPILGANSSGGSRPSAPVIGSATDGGTGTTASVAFTPSTYIGKGTITYTATSSPGNFTGTASSSPITVTGLTTGTAYTFTVQGTTNYGVTSAVSSASNSLTPASPSSFESIATATGTGSSATITFSSIPNTYKHLQIRCLAKTTATGGYSRGLNINFNSDTATNYASHFLYGDGTSAASSYEGPSIDRIQLFSAVPDSTINANILGASIIDVIDYANTSKLKTLRAMVGNNANGTSTGVASFASGLWLSTNAISTISFVSNSGFFTTNTTFALYGIKG